MDYLEQLMYDIESEAECKANMTKDLVNILAEDKALFHIIDCLLYMNKEELTNALNTAEAIRIKTIRERGKGND